LNLTYNPPPVINKWLDSYANLSVTESTQKTFMDVTYWANPLINFLTKIFEGNATYGVYLVIILIIGAFALYKINTMSSSASQIFWVIMTFGLIFVILMFWN